MGRPMRSRRCSDEGLFCFALSAFSLRCKTVRLTSKREDTWASRMKSTHKPPNRKSVRGSLAKEDFELEVD